VDDKIPIKDKTTVKEMSHEALHDLIHFDKKIFRTVPILLFKPGLLTERTLEEPKSRYVRPFTLFVFINFVFFMIKSKSIFNYTLDSYMDTFETAILKKQAALNISMSTLAERFNMAIHFEEKEYLIIMVPLFALALTLLYINKKIQFTQHLVFALHFYSFLIIFLLLVPWLVRPVQALLNSLHSNLDLTHSEFHFILIIITVNFFYLYFSLKRVYGQRMWLTSLKSLFLSLTVLALIIYVYRIALFFIVMRSLSE
jgi:Protein of unknown function (DUF3667)